MLGKENVIQFLAGFDPRISVLVLSVLPIMEPRYALLAGIAVYGLSPWEALVLSVIGLVILVTTITLVVEAFLESAKGGLLSRLPLVKSFVTWLEARSLTKVSPLVDRYGWIGLIVFVAVPLPFTGVYTGSIASILLGIKGKRMFLALFLGGLISILINLFIILGIFRI